MVRLPQGDGSISIVPNEKQELFFEVHLPGNVELLELRRYGWQVPPSCPLPSWLSLRWRGTLGCHATPASSSTRKRKGSRLHASRSDMYDNDYVVHNPPKLALAPTAEIYGEQSEVASTHTHQVL